MARRRARAPAFARGGHPGPALARPDGRWQSRGGGRDRRPPGRAGRHARGRASHADALVSADGPARGGRAAVSGVRARALARARGQARRGDARAVRPDPRGARRRQRRAAWAPGRAVGAGRRGRAGHARGARGLPGPRRVRCHSGERRRRRALPAEQPALRPDPHGHRDAVRRRSRAGRGGDAQGPAHACHLRHGAAGGRAGGQGSRAGCGGLHRQADSKGRPAVAGPQGPPRGLSMRPADQVSERELRMRWYPRLRLAGLAGLAAVAVLHNVFVLERYSVGNLLAIVGGLAAWLLLSWLALRHAYDRPGRVDLALAVELGDVVVWMVVIYLTGAERSLLLFLVLLRAADMRAVSFRRILFFGHFSVACYVLLLLYVAVVDKHHLQWPRELVKVGILYAANLYLAYTAKAVDAFRAVRRRTRQAQTVVLANVSHELRTPLNGVIGGTRLLESTELTQAQRHHVAMVRGSAEAMLGLIDEVLDFSKLEASKLTIEPIAFALRATLAESVRPLTPRADAKGLVLRVRVAADVPDALVGDSVRLRQIVTNLVANAIKFTDDGEVELRATLEPGDADTLVLHLAVRDTGIGIPSDRRQAIFEAFTQADGSTTRTHGGTGLGLTIAARLAELMGGRLWVESDLGRGSTFHATLRCRLAPPPLEPAAPALAGAAALVAEPNGGHRATLGEMLHGWGMVTTQAGGGAEGRAGRGRGPEGRRPSGVRFVGLRLGGGGGRGGG